VAVSLSGGDCDRKLRLRGNSTLRKIGRPIRSDARKPVFPRATVSNQTQIALAQIQRASRRKVPVVCCWQTKSTDPIASFGRCDGTETGLFAGGKIQYDGGHWIGSLCHRSLGTEGPACQANATG